VPTYPGASGVLSERWPVRDVGSELGCWVSEGSGRGSGSKRTRPGERSGGVSGFGSGGRMTRRSERSAGEGARAGLGLGGWQVWRVWVALVCDLHAHQGPLVGQPVTEGWLERTQLLESRGAQCRLVSSRPGSPQWWGYQWDLAGSGRSMVTAKGAGLALWWVSGGSNPAPPGMKIDLCGMVVIAADNIAAQLL
jgi:hypothetical protein